METGFNKEPLISLKSQCLCCLISTRIHPYYYIPGKINTRTYIPVGHCVQEFRPSSDEIG